MLKNMDSCKECIAYIIHHDLAEPGICEDCGQYTMVWKQDRAGTFYAECTNCGSLVAVDLNTPCEQDSLFEQQVQLVIEPQSHALNKRAILDVARQFHLNVLQMREKLIDGYTIEAENIEVDYLAKVLDQYEINYRIIRPIDPREKYRYYEKCGYPYSPMREYRD